MGDHLVHYNNLVSMLPNVKHSYENKLYNTNKIIRDVLEENGYKCVVCTSFGKDSLVVLHLVLSIYPKIAVTFQNTSVQHKSTYEHRDKILKQWNITKFYETRPIKPFWSIVKEYGFSFSKTKNNFCCQYLKEKPFELLQKDLKFNVIIQGFRAQENEQRMFTIKRKGLYYTHKTKGYKKLQPIGHWLESDINRYIEENEIELPEIYKYKSRSGCLPCTAYKSWEKELSGINLKLYRRIKRKMGRPTLHEFLPCKTVT